jgi:glycosyltransferase involved in cell wall biosynthesis
MTEVAERIAIVHERFTEVAGSEHVVEQLALEWPTATVHASIARPAGIPAKLPTAPITTWLDRGYQALGARGHAPLMPLMPRAFRGMDLGPIDAAIVSHHAFATQAAFATDAPVIAYVHSPARWAWDPALRAGEGGGRAGALALTALSRLARQSEIAAARRLAVVVANSTAVAQRVNDWWGRDAQVIHPPVDTNAFTPDASVHREDFFLLAGRLVPYKRPDLAVRAAQRAGVRLVVAGDGRAMAACKESAGPNTTFIGRVSHDELLRLHRSAKALLMPGIEDFGIVPVEAMATGTPVIALGEGGACDTVIPGKTGELLEPGEDEAVVERFAAAMREFDADRYDREEIRGWAESFSQQHFRARMHEVVSSVL